MRKYVVFFIICFFCGIANAIEIPDDEIWYSSSDKQIITPYSPYFGVDIVSNTYNDKGVIKFRGPIKLIGDYAFYSCDRLLSICIPSSIISIGNYSFFNCNKLSTFYYGGTNSEWKQLSKKTNWNTNTILTTIHCQDGNIVDCQKR